MTITIFSPLPYIIIKPVNIAHPCVLNNLFDFNK